MKQASWATVSVLAELVLDSLALELKLIGWFGCSAWFTDGKEDRMKCQTLRMRI